MATPCQRSPGFTLVELMVVTAIIGILTSVALPFFARYKMQAVDSDMHSALHSARNAMEAYFVENQTYTGATEAELITDYGFRRSADVLFKDPPVTTQNSYVLSVCEAGGTTPAFTYDSTTGQSVPSACP